jgi:hypothetical protein
MVNCALISSHFKVAFIAGVNRAPVTMKLFAAGIYHLLFSISVYFCQ